MASLFNARIRPTIITVAEAKAKHIAIEAINESVNEKIEEKNLSYDELIHLQKNNNGEITALQANIVKMNQLKSALSISIQEKIAQVGSTKANIPLGNIINSEMLAGWGPKVPVRLIPVGTTQINFKNNFHTAGINQTKHEIYLEIQAEVVVLFPTIRKSTEVTTSIPVAETIIVGTVPDSYTNFEGDTEQVSDKFLDLN